MSNEIDALLARVDDAALRQDLQEHIARISRKRNFGLVFEEHTPESVRLPEHRIRRGTKVVRQDAKNNTDLSVVLSLDLDDAVISGPESRTSQVPINELVAVAEFGEPVYPGLERVGSVRRGDAKPAHVVISGENHHALEALQFTHSNSVDCIYIDPPYNTGNKDWKYNNDYVDGSDDYRHSKWLSFMQRRLLLARSLLKSDSVLVVTIDEHEVNRLGTLLEQLFPDADVTLVTIVINPKGVTRPGARRFSRVEEYAFFCFFGDAELSSGGDDFLTLGGDDLEREAAEDGQVRRPRWKGLLRSGSNARRVDRKDMFYPVLIDEESGAVVTTGEPLPYEEQPDFESKINGYTPVWPVRKSGALGRWGVGHTTLRTMIDQGYVSVGGFDANRNTWALSYLSKEPQEQIVTGVLDILDFDETRNVVDVAYTDPDSIARRIRTVWHRTRHDAGSGGTDTLSKLIGARKFTFPKSVLAVRDTIEMLTKDNKTAVVLDFFAGSGTTTHATMMLNAEDGGARQSILVTNNEVGTEDALSLTKDGFQPGDPEWEANGIFQDVTKPRLEAAASGVAGSGDQLTDSLKNADGSLASGGFDENIEFVKLTYLNPQDVELNRAFAAIAPMLWMKAGSTGPVLEESFDATGRRKPYVVSSQYAVLFNPDCWRSFIGKLSSTVRTVFVVTDSPSTFQGIGAELPAGVEAFRLYENYLTTFAINTGRAL